MSFDYLIDKVRAAEMLREPFAHLQVNQFLSDEHFRQITTAPEIALHDLASTEQLFERLFEKGWKIIGFPGCITNKDIYLDWYKHRDSRPQTHNNTACEGFGMTLRLVAPVTPFIGELDAFLGSDAFMGALAERFDIGMEDVYYDGGLQKYLDGYEISPHPDIRRKALTYMVNINPGAGSEQAQHHTHYCTFKDAYKYVQAYWEGHPGEDRCWVPWDWCDSKKIQRENNSIVIFSPGNDTLHAVKAKYDHLHSQRTQLYGNLWYHDNPKLPMPDWENFVIHMGKQKGPTLQDKARAALPTSFKRFIKSKIPGYQDVQGTVAERKRGK